MKRILFVFLVIASLLSACTESTTSVRKEAATVESQDQIYLNSQPIPVYDYSPERDIFIQNYNFRMQNVPTWTVICANTGVCMDSCPSLGYPIPADVQLTNPLKAMTYFNTSESVYTVEQREPNGLFSSKNTAGTWVTCVYGDGRAEPVYTELNATAYAHPVHVENGMIVHDLAAPASFTLDQSRLSTNQGKPIQYQAPSPVETVAAP